MNRLRPEAFHHYISLIDRLVDLCHDNDRDGLAYAVHIIDGLARIDPGNVRSRREALLCALAHDEDLAKTAANLELVDRVSEEREPGTASQ
jgi:hypothetical protein